MSALIPVAEARQRLVESLKPLATESIPLMDAVGRVLAEDVTARTTHPPADVSAMDGYAVRSADVATVPTDVNLVGESAAGHPWKGAVQPGQAVRIFTGAHVPKGADAVVIQEDTSAAGTAITIKESSAAGRHIRPAGQDFKSGDVLLRAPRRLTARDIGLAGAGNNAHLRVYRRPRIGVLSTGDEIAMPGEAIGLHQIVSANGPSICAFVRQHGGIGIHLGVVRDEATALRTALDRAEPLDMLVTSGGVSVGDRDLMKQALATDDFALAFHKIAMRPGKPLLFGRLKDLPIMGLPGNPVSAMVCAILFLGPALERLQGLPGAAPALMLARLGVDMKPNDGREDYVRATVSTAPDGAIIATPFIKQDSAMISTLAQSDALIVRPPQATAAKAGDPVSVLILK